MKILNKEQVEHKFQNDYDTLLVNVLPRSKFERQHIPGSVNVDVAAPDFIRQFEKKASDVNQEIIVYCAGYDCPLSTEAAEKLKKAGYKRVYDFKGGLEEWREDGGEIRSLADSQRVSGQADNPARF